MELSDKVIYILDTLESAGYRADIVGGPVRDFMLGKQPSDYDITTSALPCEVKAVFAEHKTVDTGIKHGTVTLVLDGEPYEITTYRTDGEYKDMRHPESVTFTADIREDLSRRDFTVNAMAYSPRHGLTDVFGGREDLERSLIRAVGDPVKRFGEDALRILRAVRFSSVLGFDIEESTAQALRTLAPSLSKISAERVFAEWTKLLEGGAAYTVISEYREVIGVILPEISALSMPNRAVFDTSEPYIRHLSLFAMAEDAPSVLFYTAMTRLRSPAAYRDRGAAVLSMIDSPLLTDGDVGRILYSIGEENTCTLAKLRALLGREDGDAVLRVDSYISRALAYKISHLALDGNDLSALGIRGKRIGELLKELLLAVIDSKVENERAALIEYLKGLPCSNAR